MTAMMNGCTAHQVTPDEVNMIDNFLMKRCRVNNPYTRQPMLESLCSRWEAEAEKYGYDLRNYLQRFINIANSL
jgi:hypothetical protein